MLVRPKRRIVDHRSHVTGLSAKDFEVRARPFLHARMTVDRHPLTTPQCIP